MLSRSLAQLSVVLRNLMQGAASVAAFEILPKPADGRKTDNPWPEWPLIFRVDYGHDEAVTKTGVDPRTYSISTKRFLTTTNAAGVKVLTGLETVEVRNRFHCSTENVCTAVLLTTKSTSKSFQVRWEKDAKGAWKLIEVEGTLKTHECDMCILAMGFVGPEKVR